MKKTIINEETIKRYQKIAGIVLNENSQQAQPATLYLSGKVIWTKQGANYDIGDELEFPVLTASLAPTQEKYLGSTVYTCINAQHKRQGKVFYNKQKDIVVFSDMENTIMVGLDNDSSLSARVRELGGSANNAQVNTPPPSPANAQQNQQQRQKPVLPPLPANAQQNQQAQAQQQPSGWRQKVGNFANKVKNKMGLNESEVKRFKTLAGIPLNESVEQVNELDMNSYAKSRDNTDLYPYTIMNQKDDGTRSIGRKKERVNKLSGERFIQEFRKKYAEAQLILVNTKTGTKHVLTFNDLKFNNNGTSYSLVFNHENNPAIWVEKQGHKGKRSYYISDHDFKRVAEFIGENPADLKIADESNALLLQMVDYGV
jgi:hypothetical protein